MHGQQNVKISDRLTIRRILAYIGDEVTFSEQIKKYSFSKSEILTENLSLLIFVLKKCLFKLHICYMDNWACTL